MLDTSGLSLAPSHVREDALRAAAQAIPSALPLHVLFVYIYLVGFDEALFMDWSPWLEDLDMRKWPLQSRGGR